MQPAHETQGRFSLPRSATYPLERSDEVIVVGVQPTHPHGFTWAVGECQCLLGQLCEVHRMLLSQRLLSPTCRQQLARVLADRLQPPEARCVVWPFFLAHEAVVK